MNVIVRLLPGWSIRTRVLGACCGLWVLTAIVVGAGIWGIAIMNAAFQQAANENLPTVRHLAEAERDMQRALVAQRTLMVMKSDSLAAQEQMKSYTSSIEQIAEHWKAYVVFPANAAEGELRTQFEAAQAEWKDALDVSLNEGSEKFEKARNVLRTLSTMHLNAAASNASALQARAVVIRWWMFVGIGAALASAFIVSLVLARSITRPLGEAVERLSTPQVTDTSQQRGGAAGQLVSGTHEPAARLEETAASLEEASTDEFKYHLAGESTAGTGGKRRQERRRMRVEDPEPAEFIEALTVKGTNGHHHGNGHSDDGFEEL